MLFTEIRVSEMQMWKSLLQFETYIIQNLPCNCTYIIGLGAYLVKKKVYCCGSI